MNRRPRGRVGPVAARLLAGVTAIALVIGAAGCSGLSTAYTTDPDAVTYLTWEDTTTNAALDKAFAGWTDGRFHVQRVDIPAAEYAQKITSLALARKLPDFFWCNLDTAEAMGRQGLLYNWASYAARSDSGLDRSKFSPDTLSVWYLRPDALYGLPTLSNTYGIYYNKSYLAKAGASVPTTTWGWDQLFSTVRKMKGVEGSPYGLDDGGNGSGFVSVNGVNLMSVSQGGAQIIDKPVDATKISYDSQFVSAARQLSALQRGGYLTPTDVTSSNSTAAFSSGRLGLLWGGQWLAVQFLQSSAMKPSDWGFAPMPTGTVNAQPLDSQGICSPKDLQHPDAVWAAMVHLETTVLPQVLAAAPVAPPAYEPAAEPYYQALVRAGTPSTAATARYEMSASTKVPVRFIAPWSQRVGDVTKVRWNTILNGGEPLEPGIEQIFGQMQRTVAANALY